MSDCTGGESNAVVRKRNGKRRFRRAHGTKSANIRRIQKPNLHFGLRGMICAAAALFSIAGHYIGAGLVIKNGSRIVRPIIFIVLAVLFVQTAWDIASGKLF